MILVLVEHRKGEIREVTFEMLGKAAELANKIGARVSAVLLSDDPNRISENIKPWAHEILVAKDPKYEKFNSDVYQQALVDLIQKREPELIIIGHTSQGMDLAPSLATKLGIPLITSVTELLWNDRGLVAERQIYGGKIISKVRFNENRRYMVTIQQAAFLAEEPPEFDGEVIEVKPSVDDSKVFKKVLEFEEPEAGEVDISSSEILISVGRGIGERENLDMIKELTEAVDGHLACSRPLVDKDYMPKDRQVGQSGKTVKPRLYIAIGISGASEHVIGMKNSDTIVAINKDRDAPIFRVADYGIIADLFDIIPALTKSIKERG